MTDWLRYGWEWNGREAVFSVDLRYWDLLPSLAYPYLITITCAPLEAEATKFSPKELKRVEQLHEALDSVMQEFSVPVGSVAFENLIRFYYYARESGVPDHIVSLCRSIPKLRVYTGCAYESQYTTYYQLLFPDDAKLQSTENELLIRNMEQQDGDLTLVRRITMTMAFPTEEQCDLFLGEVRRHGLTLGTRSSRTHPSHPYRVDVHGYSTLKLFDLNRLTTRAIHAAVPFDGILDSMVTEYISRT